ncbi:hypothetical protein BHM03_00017245 [Ensete ventricosum]|uniref:S-methyl-5-thioribose kinase n=1 Tax=Ensete ventricosum TaxID=4639 RepID=A0A445MF07_ENSVE|nr:hypothetical protein BHM03_00017245 [Ensete ventricosum]
MAAAAAAADGFRALDEASLVEYIKATPALRAQLGEQLDGLVIKEVGDGNLNFVYIVTGPAVAEFCGNAELCRLTEQVVFSDPYKVAQYNRWTSPHLDHDAEAVRDDDILKIEVAELKSMYTSVLHASLITIVGVAHVEDFESIRDETKRALCERRALDCAKTILKERRKFETISQVISVVQEISAP